MSVTLVNSHVLIPHLPDWGNRVSHSRQWQCEVGRGLSGGEHRVAMRQRPRLSLAWSLVPHDSEEQAQMHARLRAAVKSGYAAVPFWGRGIQVASTSGAALTLSADPWSFLEAGDYVLIRTIDVTAGETWETAEVASIAGSVVTMTGALGTAWGTEAWCWPLLFGQFTTGHLTHRSNWHAPLQCTLKTLVSRPFIQPELCEYIYLEAPAGSADAINCYPVGTVTSLFAGNGWDGPAVFVGLEFYGSFDSLNSYSVTDTITSMSGGSGWSAVGHIVEMGYTDARDSMNTYPDASTLGDGTGWADVASVIEITP